MKTFKFIFTFLFLFSLPIYGQTPSENTSQNLLRVKNNLIGTSFGFWMRGTTPILGANYERMMWQKGVGIVSLGGIVRFWSYAETYTNAEINYKNTFFGVQSNYNFNKIGLNDFVPFAGLTLGYNFVSDKYRGFDEASIIAYDKAYKSGLLFSAQTGMRYFINPKFAASFRLGIGTLDFSTVEFGLDIKL